MKKIKARFRFFMEFLFSAECAFAIGVTGIILAYYFYDINRPILEYDTDTTEILSSNNDADIKVHVKGKEYKDLYLTRVTLSNSGGIGLSGKDVSPIKDDPVRIVFPPKNKIVGFHIDNNHTSDEISCRLIPSENELILEFNYINPGSRIIVNILHEKNSEEFMMQGNALNVSGIEKKSEINKTICCCWVATILFYILMYVLYAYRKREEENNK